MKQVNGTSPAFLLHGFLQLLLITGFRDLEVVAVMIIVKPGP